MEFTNIKDFMDFHAESYKKLCDTNKYNDQIKLCAPYSNGGVHIYTGIDVIADDSEYPFQYEVAYKDVSFFQIEEKRLRGYGASN